MKHSKPLKPSWIWAVTGKRYAPLSFFLVFTNFPVTLVNLRSMADSESQNKTTSACQPVKLDHYLDWLGGLVLANFQRILQSQEDLSLLAVFYSHIPHSGKRIIAKNRIIKFFACVIKCKNVITTLQAAVLKI